MKKEEERKLDVLKEKLYNISKHLGYLKDRVVNVGFSLEFDITNQTLYLGSINIEYHINTKDGETLDYLTIKELKDITEGLPVTFTGYDDSVEASWDTYNDCMDDGQLVEEYWRDEADLSEQLTIKIEIEDAGNFKNYLNNKKLTDVFYIEGTIEKDKTTINFNKEEILSEKNPYLEQQDVVKVLKSLLSMDTEQATEISGIVVRRKESHVESAEIDKEFLQNIHVLLTDDKFQRLIHEHTVEEIDSGYLYIDTYKKSATLTRYFKGAHYNLNTVYDLPLTLSTKYQVEDVSDLISTATENWESGGLSGRYSRVLNKDEDYYKFASFVQKHFPSLLGEKGVLKDFGMSIRLGDVKPSRVAQTPGFSEYTVVGDDNTGVEPKPNQILAVVDTYYGNGNKAKSTDAGNFYKEYREFIKWLTGELN